jgi:[acyl-carrier-protein] S-malonyltransferase
MGRDLAEAFPESAEVFRRADEVLGEDLSGLCFSGSEESLARTEWTQPAILTVSAAAFAALRERGAVPIAAAGHSLGEWTAHVAAGTVPFADAVSAVRLRGRFMQEAVPLGVGAMAAVMGLDVRSVVELCRRAEEGETVRPANFNGGGQIVIAGHAGAVDRATALALEAGAKRAVRLSVSAPFHSPLMRPAAERMGAVLAGLPLRDPQIPVWTNVDAMPVRTAESARSTLLRQIEAPVRWEEEIRNMVDSGIDTFVEIGPGRVLSGLVRRIARDATVLSVRDAEDVSSAVAFLEARR